MKSLVLVIATLAAITALDTDRTELRPGFGVQFRNAGRIIQGINHYTLVVGFQLPQKWPNLMTIGQKLPNEFQKFCSRIKNQTIAQDSCYNVLPTLREYANQEDQYIRSIDQRLNFDLFSILPDLTKGNRFDHAVKTGEFYRYKGMPSLFNSSETDLAYTQEQSRYYKELKIKVQESLGITEKQRKLLKDAKELLNTRKYYLERYMKGEHSIPIMSLDEWIENQTDTGQVPSNPIVLTPEMKTKILRDGQVPEVSNQSLDLLKRLAQLYPTSIQTYDQQLLIKWVIEQSLGIIIDATLPPPTIIPPEWSGVPTRSERTRRDADDLTELMQQFVSDLIKESETNNLTLKTGNRTVSEKETCYLWSETNENITDSGDQFQNLVTTPIPVLNINQNEKTEVVTELPEETMTTFQWNNPQLYTDEKTVEEVWPFIKPVPHEALTIVSYPTESIISECLNIITDNDTSADCSYCVRRMCVQLYYFLHYDLFINATGNLTNEEIPELYALKMKTKLSRCENDCSYEVMQAGRNFRKRMLGALKRRKIRLANAPDSEQNSTSREKRETLDLPEFFQPEFEHERQKRMIPGFDLSSMAGVVMKGIGMLVNWRKDRKLMKAINLLERNQDRLMNKVERVDKDLMSLAYTVNKQIDSLWKQIKDNNERIMAISKIITEIEAEIQGIEEDLLDHARAIRILAWTFGTLQADLRRAMNLLEMLESRVEILFNAIDSLSTGTLTHHVISATQLTTYLQHIQAEIDKDFPNYDLALKQVNKYYDMKLVSFVAYNYSLYVHIPIYVKQKVQPLMDLYRLESIPIPFDTADIEPDENGEWIGDYTQVKFAGEYLAMSAEIFILLSEKELTDCNSFGGVYYCENTLLLTHSTEHNCASAIYHNKTDIISEKCEVEYLANYHPYPKILQDGRLIMLVAMPSPWIVQCSTMIDVPVKLEASALAVIKRTDICYCGFSAGTYYLHESISNCEEDQNKVLAQLQLYYTINTAVAEYFGKYIEEVVKVDDKWQIELEKAIDILNGSKLISRKTARVSGNLLTSTQIDLSSPDWSDLSISDPITFKELKENLDTGTDLIVRGSEKYQGMLNNISTNHMMSIIGLSLTGILACLALLQYCRVRRLDKQRKTEQSIEMANLSGRDNLAYNPSPRRKALTWIPMTILFVLPVPSDAFKQIITSEGKADTEKFQIKTIWTYQDILMILGTLFGFVILSYLVYGLLRVIKRQYINQTMVLHKLWSDQCDIYLQISTHFGFKSLKVFLGSILGPPIGLRITGEISVQNLNFRRGYFKDVLEINWGTVQILFQNSYFGFPTKIKLISPMQRYLARKIFGNTHELKICNLALVYNCQLLIRNLETLDSTMKQTRISLEPPKLPSAPIEEELGIQRNTPMRKSKTGVRKGDIVEIQCIHCQGTSYVSGKDISS